MPVLRGPSGMEEDAGGVATAVGCGVWLLPAQPTRKRVMENHTQCASTIGVVPIPVSKLLFLFRQ